MFKTTDYYRSSIKVLGGSWFFWVIVGFLVFQAGWIALSGLYPMAFDEDFHLGLIQLYAERFSPFWYSQPNDANMFGAVARDPSYLYHYLMSFPYRLISFFTSDLAIQVIVMRFINIGLFAGGLVLYRRLLLKTGVASVIVNLALLIFILLPVVPLLAAHINYDNLILPLTAAALLLAVRFDTALKRKRFDVQSLLLLLIICLTAGLVKYAFLPFFIVIVVFIVIRSLQTRWPIKEQKVRLDKDWKLMSMGLRFGLVAAVIVLSGLFIERYGVNLVRYHTPVADCGKVLSVDECSQYGPWLRDYELRLANDQNPAPTNPIKFADEWLYGMWLRTFFAVDGPTTSFQTRGPLPIPAVGAIVFGVISAVAFMLTARRLFKKYNTPVLWLFLTTIIVYILVLLLDGYEAYSRTGKAVAINGRYLLPIMPLLLLFAGASVSELLKGWRSIRAVFAVCAVLCLLWGGGALTYILRSNDRWYWQNSEVRMLNHGVQRVWGPLTPGYDDQTQFLR